MDREPHDRLREARIRAGYKSPTEAADRFVWNPNTYKSHENGVRGITPKMAERYGRAFHVSAGWILTGEGSAPPLSPEETAILSRFRLMDQPRRRVVMDMCDSLLGTMPDRIPTVATTRRKRAKRS